jgi:hypothetical protein
MSDHRIYTSISRTDKGTIDIHAELDAPEGRVHLFLGGTYITLDLNSARRLLAALVQVTPVGCSIYIPAEWLVRAGIDPEGPTPYYTLAGGERGRYVVTLHRSGDPASPERSRRKAAE